MPHKNTFDIKPIRSFVKHYLQHAEVSVDPFARNKRLATYTNDLNAETTAEYHLAAFDFLYLLYQRGIKADLILFDPPYSLRQVKECYQHIGKEFFQEDSQNVIRWSKEKNLCAKLLTDKGVFIHFGWHSNGLGKKYGFAIEELLLVAHGGCHNDTICIVERKFQSGQLSFN